MLASIRSVYADALDRRPGIDTVGNTHHHLATVLKGLLNLAPTPQSKPLPLLQHHLRAVRQVLDLKKQLHRVLWTLWLPQWQGVFRAGDLLRERGVGVRGWQPTRYTHRERVSVAVARDPRGRAIGVGLTIRLHPIKTDQSGQSGATRTFFVNRTEGALSAAAEMVDMLEHDPVPGD